MINKKDVEVAMQFFLELDSKRIVLQIPSNVCLPYVKREIHRLLGQPSFAWNDMLKYDDRIIHIKCLLSHSGDFEDEELFLIETDKAVYGYKYLSQLGFDMSGEQSEPFTPDVWRLCNMSVSDIHHVVQSSGVEQGVVV